MRKLTAFDRPAQTAPRIVTARAIHTMAAASVGAASGADHETTATAMK